MKLGRDAFLEGFKAQYGEDALKGITVQVLINDFVNSGGKLPDLIDPIWYGDFRDRQSVYLMKSENGFEVFSSERGGKFGVVTFKTLDDAVFAFVSRWLNNNLIDASDAKN
jgi:hypothetical protein